MGFLAAALEVVVELNDDCDADVDVDSIVYYNCLMSMKRFTFMITILLTPVSSLVRSDGSGNELSGSRGSTRVFH